MKRLCGIAIVAIPMAILVWVSYLFSAFYLPPVNATSMNGLAMRAVTVGDVQVMAEVAVTRAEQAQGLGDRISLLPDEGMLFPFKPASRPGFWMKDMRLPLDFVYLENGKVVELKEGVQPTLRPEPFFPNEDVDGVLEVNAGWVGAHGIKVGDAASY